MPLFFFDVHDGHSLPDREGTDFPDRKALRADAIVAAAEALKDGGGLLPDREWVMTVSDEDGTAVMTLRFSVAEY